MVGPMTVKPTYEHLEQRVKSLEVEIAELKKIEASLQDSHANLQALLENTSDYILISDMHGSPTIFNTAYAEIMKEALGIEMKPGIKPHQLIKDKEAVAFWDGLHNRVLSGEKFRVEYAHRFSEENERHLEVSFHPIKQNGKVSGFSEVTRDITKRKRAEEALRRSEEKYRDLIENAVVGMYQVSAKGKYFMANRKLASAFGYGSPKEFLEAVNHVSKLYTFPEQRDEILKEINSRGFVEKKEVEFKRKDGSPIWIELNTRVATTDNGTVVYEGTAEDITERKQAERTIRQHNAYLSALNETTLRLMRRLDLDELLEAIVSRVASLVGTKDGYVYLWDGEKDYIEMRVGLGAQKAYEGLRLKPGEGLAGKVWETGGPLIVNDYRAWDNRLHEARFDDIRATVGIPLKSESGVSGVIGLAYFEENRKFTEQEAILLSQFAELASIALDNARLYKGLKQANEELEQRVENRTVELRISNEQLEIQKKNLEEVNTALRVLLKKRDEDKSNMEQKVLFNMNELILPYMVKLNSSNLDERQKVLLDILESNLNDITSPFSQSLSHNYTGFTPSEMQIANLIKQGRTSKQIAELQNLSSRTIETHRKNIRKKLGLGKKKTNLRTHLLSIQ
jgi:PAS domain S-box-containing protein